MKLAGSFQRRLSCFLFRESGCLQSPRLSAPRQSIRPSPITTLLRFLTLVTQQPNPRGGRRRKLLLLGAAAASTFLHPCLSSPSPTVHHHRTTPADCSVLWHYSSMLRNSEGLLQTLLKSKLVWSIFWGYLLHTSCNEISLQYRNWILSAANDAGCARWLVKFIPFCSAPCQSPHDWWTGLMFNSQTGNSGFVAEISTC